MDHADVQHIGWPRCICVQASPYMPSQHLTSTSGPCPALLQDIEAIFGRSNVFGHVARFIMQPAPYLQRRIEATIGDKFGRFNVGLHLRITKPMPAGRDPCFPWDPARA